MKLTDILAIGRHLTIPGASTTSESQPADSVASPGGSGASGGAGGSTWCATFTPTRGPWGQLPELLQESPSRLSLQPYFQEWGWTYGVSPALLEAIAWQESGWQEGVVSSAQAVGVGQLLPSTASFVSQYLIGEPLNINSAYDNIRMMARFVAYLQTQVQGTCNVVAAYYEGTQNLNAYGVLPETEPYVADVEYLMSQFS
jgi:soluble lytic murein transglycosylase-like protein